MAIIIAAEHFELTENAKSEILSELSKLEAIVKEGVQIRVYLKVTRHGFHATVKVHSGRKLFVSVDDGKQVCKLVSILCLRLRREILARRKKAAQARRRSIKKPAILEAA